MADTPKPGEDWHEIQAKDLQSFHLGHRLMITDKADTTVSGLLESLTFNRRSYLDGEKVHRDPLTVAVLINFGDAEININLHAASAVHIKRR